MTFGKCTTWQVKCLCQLSFLLPHSVPLLPLPIPIPLILVFPLPGRNLFSIPFLHHQQGEDFPVKLSRFDFKNRVLLQIRKVVALQKVAHFMGVEMPTALEDAGRFRHTPQARDIHTEGLRTRPGVNIHREEQDDPPNILTRDSVSSHAWKRSRDLSRHSPLFSEASPAGDQKGGGGDGVEASTISWLPAPLAAVYKFTRPHTIRGTILASVVGVARALVENPECVDLALVPRALFGLLGLLLGNAWIVGVNQIYDVDIDRVNKPYLPVASGELTRTQAWILLTISGVLGPLLVRKFYPGLIFLMYMSGLVIGTSYSVPPFHLKRFPVAAGLIIATVRGFLLNFGVYYAARQALGLPFVWNPSVVFLARFMTVFALVIAITKDLPDVEGDKKYKVDTFATKLGVKKVATIACALLGSNYLSAILEAGWKGVKGSSGGAAGLGRFLFGEQLGRWVPMVGGHFIFLCLLLRNLSDLKENSQESIKLFYRRIWDLFYLEYALYPFV
uniref:Homogentisate phytyltransferase n=1 Tax=Chromera velia CCMP2878 TaxID=1169474 RepID=A0A0G4FQG2_9ALVE|eukprot:Cvel_18171.t1-p1 / transcript=Cvel_18171.t1 / gene=Cvel_18171 / organism=Chromera_velia_CCMP2878 / gene_product=Homogentisate phytyltransferase 2, chloroplastic, putative / transcript_product=Homogentisate phytyltransferase 2, chloroplastic, putative / location=Cvel_scaffold1490:26564-29489(-) / protein_length=502 / sequence_SO=supercontig / SO=protein_coding / is_pseudo=false